MGETIRILIVEQDRIYRDGLRLMIEKTVDFELVAVVDSVSDAVNFSHQLEPNVIIVDHNCTHLPTTVVLQQLQLMAATTCVLIFSSNENPSDILRYLEIGASGYLNKGKDSQQLVQAIRLIASGNMVIDKLLHEKLKEKLMNQSCFSTQHFPQLTHRENQIVALLAQGLRNKEIANNCNITEKTVRNHVSSIFSKLNVSNRIEAIGYIQTIHSNVL